MGEDTQSLRTCVGCHGADGREAMLRFVMAGDPPRVTPDVRRTAPGRGASLHPRRRCLDAAIRKGGFKRAFRRDVSETSEALVETISAQYLRRAQGLLLAGQRSRNLAVGTEEVKRAIAAERVALLVVAGDAAASRKQVMAGAERLGERCHVMATTEELGRLLGRASVGVLAVLDAGIGRELGAALEHIRALAEESA